MSTSSTRQIALEDSTYPGFTTRMVLTHGKNHRTGIPLTRSELETVVQEAYIRYGIIAVPSYAKEAEAGRAIEDAREVSDQADYLAAHDPAQTTIEEHLELDTSKLETNLDAARAKLNGALRARLTGEVR